MSHASEKGAQRAVNLFIAFRVFFNARFYYPVYAVLFLDLGLTVAQFALLNTVWALTIVLFEVPSGAISDTFGRKTMVVSAGVLMVAEMAVLALAPAGNLQVLFWALFANRILSGLAEACASGSDEALAYDSLTLAGRESEWPVALERTVRWQSAGFFVAMLTGAAVYDPAFVQRCLQVFNPEVTVTAAETIRLPIYLTAAGAVAALVTTLAMREPEDTEVGPSHCGAEMLSVLRHTLSTGKWIAKSPFVFAVILAALFFDSLIRLFMTLGAQYYRILQIPESVYGIIGSSAALLGFVVPRYARKLAQSRSPFFNLMVLGTLATVGLIGICLFIPWWSLIFVFVAFIVFHLTSYFTSVYLNEATPSAKRATVLSFKGLALNIAYGGLSFLLALLLKGVKTGPGGGAEDASSAALRAGLPWLIPYFFGGFLFLLLVFRWLRPGGRRRREAEPE